MRFFPLFFRLVHQNCLIFGLSTNWSLRPQESRLSVRSSVRSSVTLFLGNRSLLFSETLQLVRACKFEKNVPSAFLIIFTVLAILAKNWSKSLKNLKVRSHPSMLKRFSFIPQKILGGPTWRQVQISGGQSRELRKSHFGV